VSNPIDELWQHPHTHPEIAQGDVHVWRVALDDSRNIDAHFAFLSTHEQQRAARFYFRAHRLRYVIAHGALRALLSQYTLLPAAALELIDGPHGKPEFATSVTSLPHELHFNLSHSADTALVAVSRTGPVGVDVEFWRPDVQHLAVAERFFSSRERVSLSALRGDAALMRGFFAAWSRKEAYLKATGFGISRGLHHFDVSLAPDAPAEILEDRLDASATNRWAMANIEAGPSYSAAVVATRPVAAIKLFQTTDTELPT
jgi:4'-phosphopantetheinyl transferase